MIVPSFNDFKFHKAHQDLPLTKRKDVDRVSQKQYHRGILSVAERFGQLTFTKLSNYINCPRPA